MESLADLTARALAEIAASADLPRLEEVRVHWLGKKGAAHRAAQVAGRAARRRAARCRARASTKPRWRCRLPSMRGVQCSTQRPSTRKLQSGRVDVTLDGRGERNGGLHPVTRARLRIEEPVSRRGLRGRAGSGDRGRLPQFQRAEHAGRPSGARHARHVLSEHVVNGERALLRTHTSPVQIRALRAARDACRWRSSRRGACIAWTPTPRTRRCSTRSKGCWWMRA